MIVKRIGVDLAKNVFQVHGVDARERVVVRKRLKRDAFLAYFAQLPPCLVGLEACGGAHHWARRLQAMGHEVRLMAARFVAPYRQNDKNDGNDAEAVCEAVARPRMRFVPIKSEEQQAVLGLHRARELVVGQGRVRLRQALPDILEDAENGIPDLARELFSDLYARLMELEAHVEHFDRRLKQLAAEMEPARRLMAVGGIGPVTATATATAMVASSRPGWG